jgi:hypothetical protein
MRVLASLLAVFTLAHPGVAKASTDGTGDTYPVVLVQDGRFVVLFKSSGTASAPPRFYRSVIDSDGNFLERRVQLEGREADQAARALKERLDGAPVPDGTGTVALEFGPGGDGRPFLVRTAPGMRAKRIALRWGAADVDRWDVGSVAASADAFVLVAGPSLVLHRFDRRGTGHTSVRVGEPSKVCFHHCWPRASPVLAVGDRFVLAWVAQDESLKLTWWRPSDGKLVTTQLAPRADTNLVSLASMGGGPLLVAYSEPEAPGAPIPPEGHAEIRYHFLRALPDE